MDYYVCWGYHEEVVEPRLQGARDGTGKGEVALCGQDMSDIFG